MKKTKKPSFNLEKNLLTKNIELVFGMDEVGRGSFAGPLVAAAVAFEKEFPWFNELNDSKLLSALERERLSKLILGNGKCFTEIIDVALINKIGIGKCNVLIFENLINNILNKFENRKSTYFLIDGRNTFKSSNTKFIVKGDRESISIAAASIIAKVFRDKMMKDLDNTYSGYDFSRNKGYGTKFHQEAIGKLGLCAIHRKSFNLNKFI
jgi:ribonuclease HII